MLLWRLSERRWAERFDGGYGLLHDGRWNTAGHAVTYAATSPALCVLEKLVHVEDPALLPALAMVVYDVGDAAVTDVPLEALPPEWRRREIETQTRGDRWHEARETCLLLVPSAILPLAASPDANVLINNAHPGAGAIRVERVVPFTFDNRLF